MVLHLSVASDGIVSLWDTAEQAQRVEGEIYLPLKLTAEQYEQVARAVEQATKPNQPPPDDSGYICIGCGVICYRKNGLAYTSATGSLHTCGLR